MTSFNVSVPFAGEAVSVFKSVTDLFSYVDVGREKLTRISDDTSSFSFPVTFGVFRLLLDGECVVVDRDFDSHVSLMSVTSRDRGGKGKLDARIRVFLDESVHSSSVNCECDVTTKGMLARVDLPLEDVMTEKIRSAMLRVIEESGNAIIIDGFTQANLSLGIDAARMPIETLDKDVVSSLLAGGNLRLADTRDKPMWVSILQFPASLVMYPIAFARGLATALLG